MGQGNPNQKTTAGMEICSHLESSEQQKVNLKCCTSKYCKHIQTCSNPGLSSEFSGLSCCESHAYGMCMCHPPTPLHRWLFTGGCRGLARDWHAGWNKLPIPCHIVSYCFPHGAKPKITISRESGDPGLMIFLGTRFSGKPIYLNVYTIPHGKIRIPGPHQVWTNRVSGILTGKSLTNEGVTVYMKHFVKGWNITISPIPRSEPSKYWN